LKRALTDAIEPEVIHVIGDFLAKVPKSVVLLRLSPFGEILGANPAFTALFPSGKWKECHKVQEFLESSDAPVEEGLPMALVTYRLLGSMATGTSIQGIHVPVSEGSVLVGELVLPPSTEGLDLLTATTNEMARLNREVQRNYHESKRAQNQLESRHKLLVTSTDQGMVQFDAEGHVFQANPGAIRILGLSDLPRIEDCLMQASGEDGVALPREGHPVIHALRSGRSRLGAVLGLRKGATWLLLDALPEFTSDEAAPHGVCATFNDITERTRGEETLLALTQRLQLATASAHLGVWDWDLQTGAMSWDDRMLEIYGITREVFRGDVENWKQGLHPEDRERALAECEAALKGEAPFDTEFRVARGDGTLLWVKASATVQRDSSGHPRRMIGLNQDITERKLAEEERSRLRAQLQQSQKMESLGLLAGGVAHDMNNVLGAILGLASAHLGSLPGGSPLRRSLETICQATERGGQMVSRLLNFARQNPSEFTCLDFNTILRDESSLLERTTLAKVHTRLDLTANLLPIRGDASALTHAIMNLCVNAVDAMPLGGTLTLRTRNVDERWIEVRVEDTGAGMPREVLEKALDPFFTTKGIGKGTGLGLSMVYSTVRAHGGELFLQSEPGSGTCILIRFPAYEDEELSLAPMESRAASASDRSMEVLLVDDDELIQISVETLFEVLGHRVHAALTGEEALAVLGGGFKPDLVILDMNMPGLGGAGTLPLLRELDPNVPILLSTGRADESARSLASAHPGVTLVSKPFGLRELQKHLEVLGLA